MLSIVFWFDLFFFFYLVFYPEKVWLFDDLVSNYIHLWGPSPPRSHGYAFQLVTFIIGRGRPVAFICQIPELFQFPLSVNDIHSPTLRSLDLLEDAVVNGPFKRIATHTRAPGRIMPSRPLGTARVPKTEPECLPFTLPKVGADADPPFQNEWIQ